MKVDPNLLFVLEKIVILYVVNVDIAKTLILSMPH